MHSTKNSTAIAANAGMAKVVPPVIEQCALTDVLEGAGVGVGVEVGIGVGKYAGTSVVVAHSAGVMLGTGAVVAVKVGVGVWVGVKAGAGMGISVGIGSTVVRVGGDVGSSVSYCTGYSQALTTSNAVNISRPISGLGG